VPAAAGHDAVVRGTVAVLPMSAWDQVDARIRACAYFLVQELK